MFPKMTRRAFRPLKCTLAGWPFSDQPARNGGNISRSVSSWASTTRRRGKAWICRRIRRFFLALRVGIEDIAGPLPDVAEPPRHRRTVSSEGQSQAPLQFLLK